MNGEIIVKPQFQEVLLEGYLLEGVIAISYDKEYWGFMDKNGNIIIEPRFIRVTPLRS